MIQIPYLIVKKHCNFFDENALGKLYNFSSLYELSLPTFRIMKCTKINHVNPPRKAIPLDQTLQCWVKWEIPVISQRCVLWIHSTIMNQNYFEPSEKCKSSLCLARLISPGVVTEITSPAKRDTNHLLQLNNHLEVINKEVKHEASIYSTLRWTLC